MKELRTVYNIGHDSGQTEQTHSLNDLMSKIKTALEAQVRLEGYAKVMIIDEDCLCVSYECTVCDGGEEEVDV